MEALSHRGRCIAFANGLQKRARSVFSEGDSLRDRDIWRSLLLLTLCGLRGSHRPAVVLFHSAGRKDQSLRGGGKKISHATPHPPTAGSFHSIVTWFENAGGGWTYRVKQVERTEAILGTREAAANHRAPEVVVAAAVSPDLDNSPLPPREGKQTFASPARSVKGQVEPEWPRRHCRNSSHKTPLSQLAASATSETSGGWGRTAGSQGPHWLIFGDKGKNMQMRPARRPGFEGSRGRVRCD